MLFNIMPHKYNFNVESIVNIENVEGWKPLIIEYGYDNINGINNLCWKVKGTDHTFTIPTKVINFTSNNYEQHFKEVLLLFKKDYDEWQSQNFPYEWQQEYYRMFSKYFL